MGFLCQMFAHLFRNVKWRGSSVLQHHQGTQLVSITFFFYLILYSFVKLSHSGQVYFFLVTFQLYIETFACVFQWLKLKNSLHWYISFFGRKEIVLPCNPISIDPESSKYWWNVSCLLYYCVTKLTAKCYKLFVHGSTVRNVGLI